MLALDRTNFDLTRLDVPPPESRLVKQPDDFPATIGDDAALVASRDKDGETILAIFVSGENVDRRVARHVAGWIGDDLAKFALKGTDTTRGTYVSYNRELVPYERIGFTFKVGDFSVDIFAVREPNSAPRGGVFLNEFRERKFRSFLDGEKRLVALEEKIANGRAQCHLPLEPESNPIFGKITILVTPDGSLHLIGAPTMDQATRLIEKGGVDDTSILREVHRKSADADGIVREIKPPPGLKEYLHLGGAVMYWAGGSKLYVAGQSVDFGGLTTAALRKCIPSGIELISHKPSVADVGSFSFGESRAVLRSKLGDVVKDAGSPWSGLEGPEV